MLSAKLNPSIRSHRPELRCLPLGETERQNFAAIGIRLNNAAIKIYIPVSGNVLDDSEHANLSESFSDENDDRFSDGSESEDNDNEIFAVAVNFDIKLLQNNEIFYLSIMSIKNKQWCSRSCSQLLYGQYLDPDRQQKLHPIFEIMDSTGLHILSKLARHGQRKHTCLQWIPSHVGVPGNEAADELVGRGCKLSNPSSTALSVRKFIPSKELK
ncbi:nup43 [Trichonephila clavipes]|nr:nup43 [Trichonephila clavipes]